MIDSKRSSSNVANKDTNERLKRNEEKYTKTNPNGDITNTTKSTMTNKSPPTATPPKQKKNDKHYHHQRGHTHKTLPIKNRLKTIKTTPHQPLLPPQAQHKNCIPLPPPIPSKFQASSTTTNNTHPLPPFSLLANYTPTTQSHPPPPGMRFCVMCGHARPCSTTTSLRRHPTTSSIPRIPPQNKGLCTICDVAIWIVKTTSQQIKWCKGCKNFKLWVLWGSKGTASKCEKCRERICHNYAMKTSVKNDDSRKRRCGGGGVGGLVLDKEGWRRRKVSEEGDVSVTSPAAALVRHCVLMTGNSNDDESKRDAKDARLKNDDRPLSSLQRDDISSSSTETEEDNGDDDDDEEEEERDKHHQAPSHQQKSPSSCTSCNNTAWIVLKNDNREVKWCRYCFDQVTTTSSSAATTTARREEAAAAAAARCIPLPPPIPEDYRGEMRECDIPALPPFRMMMNYPQEGRRTDDDGQQQQRCVMCGTYCHFGNVTDDNESPSQVIVPGNNGVCNICNVIIWVVTVTTPHVQVKWCHSCSNFRPWAHFDSTSKTCRRCDDIVTSNTETTGTTKTRECTVTTTTNLNCIRSKTTAEKWTGDERLLMGLTVPPFATLVNYMSQESPTSSSRDGIKICVMCGIQRPCIYKKPSSPRSSSRQPQRLTSTTPTPIIIPSQNKGLCTACDVSVWIIRRNGLEIKWCKGCKNFKLWMDFGDKGRATKCQRCRERIRETYERRNVSGVVRGRKRMREGEFI